MRRALRFLAGGLLTSMLFATVAFSQGSQTGGITGVVTDPQGSVVPGATVEIINEGTGKSERTMTTDENGAFTATLLPPGAYRLAIKSANFKQVNVTGVQVRIGESTRQDVALEVGGVTENVNIEATPTLINPNSATTGQAINAETLQTLPLASPNFLFLLSLSAGVAGEPTDVRTAGRGTADVSVNGQRTSNNSVTLEGVNVNDFNLAHFDTVPLPNPNTIQEFKVATSLYDASSGSKGGGAIGLVLRSGSKDFHFDLYWTHRNDALNANEWFFNKSGTKRGRLLQNVFGGNASGPVPKVGGYWFFNYQGVRARNGIDPNGSSTRPIIQAFPTNSDGSTSAALLASAFGLTPAQIDPVAVNILNLRDTRFGGAFLVPRPGYGGCGAVTGGATGTFTCQFSSIAPIQDDQYLISYDRDWRDGKDKLSGRWFWDEGDVAKPFGTDTSLTNPRTDTQWNRFLSLTHTHTFSPTKVNELRAGFSRFIFANIPTDMHDLSEIGATRGNSADFPGMYRVSVTGLFSIGTGVNDDRGTISNQYNLVDTFSMVWGKHSFRMGGEAVQYQLNRFNNFSVRGSLTFGATSSGVTPAPPPLTNCTLDTNDCNAFQNFIRGRITALQSAFGDPARNFVATDYAAFFQDDYRITSRLTLNIGLRWEAMSFGHDKLFRAGIYDPALAAAGRNPFLIPEDVNVGGFTGTPGVSGCALTRCRDDNNFAPRVGFAWDIQGNQKNVLRGGYGIYYQRLSNQNILQNSLSAPFTVQPLENRSNPVALQLANPLASIPPPSIIATDYIPQASFFAGLRRTSGVGPLDVNDPNVAPIFVNPAGQRCLNFGGTATNCSINLASFTSAPLDAYTPYTQQYNLTYQRELWDGWAVEVGYVGSHYIGGLGIWDPFLAALASPSNPITVRDNAGNNYTITTNTPANEPLRHLVVGLSRARGARYSGNVGQAVYNSMQVTVLRRLHRGLYFQAAYTFSRTRDNVSGALSTDELNATRNGQGGANILNFQNNVQQNFARGDFDRPHRLVVSYSYDIPVPKSDFFNNQFFKGWSISGIVTYQNGLPFSIFDSASGGAFGATGIGTGLLVCRPLSQQIASLPGCTPGETTTIDQLLTTGSVQNRVDHYINPNFVSQATLVPSGATGATGYGNVPRNAFRGPFQQNWDLSVLKGFHLGERHQFQFRADFFNLFNHPVFREPSAVQVTTPATFGQITQTAVPARLIQFGLKYSF
ncbi:MAG TPA: carboxypeptidase-like regulatory domain-containing protein [Pyrinomonadaceae bacterium]|nr:carboxypeptidase-like regulatory domain-containing protein [Pyrinomonadaceae bacterium]